MSGSLRTTPRSDVMTKEAFCEWLKWFQSPEHLRASISLFGKPRVRVPAERQMPNEADL